MTYIKNIWQLYEPQEASFCSSHTTYSLEEASLLPVKGVSSLGRLTLLLKYYCLLDCDYHCSSPGFLHHSILPLAASFRLQVKSTLPLHLSLTKGNPKAPVTTFEPTVTLYLCFRLFLLCVNIELIMCSFTLLNTN